MDEAQQNNEALIAAILNKVEAVERLARDAGYTFVADELAAICPVVAVAGEDPSNG